MVLITGHDPFATYKAIFDGTGLNWLFPWTSASDRSARGDQPAADADPDDAADPHGPGGGVRVPLRPVQHRRPGPVHRWARYLAVWVGSSFHGHAGAAAHRALDPRGHGRRARCGRASPALFKAIAGTNEVISTIMLNWIAIWIGAWLFGLGGPLQNTNPAQKDVPVSNDVVRRREAAGVLGRPGAAGPAHRALHRARGAARVLGDPQPHGARLRGARGRLQPGRGGRRPASRCGATTSS